MSAALFPQHIIARKRDGEILTREEIVAFVRGATDGSWADYQLSALLMAIFLKGMTAKETALLTGAMLGSGIVADLSGIKGRKADKHATGGVGDKVSLHLAAMVAACGVTVPMISGRGLGHTGGTLDKLESIPGFRVTLSSSQYREQVAKIGLCLIGQTAELAPADKKLYALRDVTGTVECVPLICASILSKKMAEGTEVLVGDVKFGRGAFMKDKAHAREVAESIACLRGEGPADTMAVTYALGEQMLLLTKTARSATEARALLEAVVADGGAMRKFGEMIAAQGGDARVVSEPGRLPQARRQVPFAATRTGFVQDVDALQVALAALRLGAGRAKADDRIDHAVGFSGLVKVGEPVETGAPLCVVHASDDKALADVKEMLAEAIKVGAKPVKPVTLIDEIIG